MGYRRALLGQPALVQTVCGCVLWERVSLGPIALMFCKAEDILRANVYGLSNRYRGQRFVCRSFAFELRSREPSGLLLHMQMRHACLLAGRSSMYEYVWGFESVLDLIWGDT